MRLSLVQDALQQDSGNVFDPLLDWVRTNGPDVIWALLLLFAGWWGARLVTSFLRRLLDRRGVDRTLSGFLGTIVYMALMTMVVISAIDLLGVRTTPFVTVLGAAGLAVGLALQNSLGNFASGVLIILFRPFRAGDLVEVAGVSGNVEEVQVFATTLRTPDNKRIVVPNGSITGGTIVNYSALPTRRVDLTVGIGYGDDLAKAKRVLERLVADEPLVLKEPAPVVAVSQLGESSVNLIVQSWARTPDHGKALWSLTERVKLAFDAEEISIPFPQRDVHLHPVA